MSATVLVELDKMVRKGGDFEMPAGVATRLEADGWHFPDGRDTVQGIRDLIEPLMYHESDDVDGLAAAVLYGAGLTK